MNETLAILGFDLACIASYWVERWAATGRTEADCDRGAQACGRCSRRCDDAPGAPTSAHTP